MDNPIANLIEQNTRVIEHSADDDEVLSLSKLETLNPIAKLLGLTQKQVYFR